MFLLCPAGSDLHVASAEGATDQWHLPTCAWLSAADAWLLGGCTGRAHSQVSCNTNG
jgi:hypothetical protein